MRMSGNRAAWISACAAIIMDGGSRPPSIERVRLLAADKVGTSPNDGHVTAAIVYGEERRSDLRAGQRFIVQEVIEALRVAGFVEGDDSALRWAKSIDGEFQIEIDGHTYTFYGQRERRMSADRAMLGERDAATGELVGLPGRFVSGTAHPFEIEVIGPRGGHEKIKLEVHPLALAIPPMTEAEREMLRASIMREKKISVPIVIYQKKILDGRHRAYFASILKVPVRMETFEGTEEQAKRQVAVLNLHRRHLSTAQRAQVAYELFGEEAKKEATKARIATQGRPPKLRGKSRAVSGIDHDRRWEGIAAQKANEAGLQTSADAIKAMATVALAPKTSAAVARGEIKTVASAHEKALAELRYPAAKQSQTAHSLSDFRRLGRCITELRAVIAGDDRGATDEGMPELLSERLNEIERLAAKARYTLQQRNVFK